MSEMNTQLIEKYQEIYQKDPRSKIFASLAETYRKMGMAEEGFKVAQQGVSIHPNFIGGLVALGRCAIDVGDLTLAQKNLEKACALSRENLLAHQLLAEIYLSTKQPKLALKTYKTVLFYNPTHPKALKVVKKLESLSADEFEDDVFEMTPLTHVSSSEQNASLTNDTLSNSQLNTSHEIALERHLSIIDALISRSEIEKVDAYINEAQKEFPDHPELKKRLLILQHRSQSAPSPSEPQIPITSREEINSDTDIKYLKKLLARVKSNSSI